MGAAARVTDNHICPVINPDTSPHTGGPVSTGIPTVLIGGQMAATKGSVCVCAGPPDSVSMGSLTVSIGGQPAARQGDQTAHGGSIAAGLPTVLIGG
ncbi:PAAR domain-containing protein [Flavitalea flava]